MIAVQEKLKNNPIYSAISDYFLFKSWDDMSEKEALDEWEGIS